MGLDMYLTRKLYIDTDKRKTLKIEGVNVNPEKVEYITEEVMYWRKANAIHQWFVDNVQEGVDDCKSYYVDTEKLKELLDLIREALKTKNYETLLPTQGGFFFGNTEYDKYYIEDLKRTRDELQVVLLKAKNEPLWEYYYHSSW